MSKKILRNAINKVDLKKQDRQSLIPGILGLGSAAKKVSVPNKAGYVYVRLRNNDSEVVQAFNDVVSPVFDLPVFVIRDELDPTRYKIFGRDTGAYQNWTSWSPYLPAHGSAHSRATNSGGGDVTWVYGGQFMPLLASPSGTNGSNNVIIDSFVYYHSDYDQYKHAGGTGTGNILLYKPTDNTARMVLIYLDTDGNPQLMPGDTFDATVTGTAGILPYVPTINVDVGMPLATARIVSGTSSVLWDNLYDLRPIITGNDKDKIAVYDSGAFQVSGTAISFDDNLSVVVTGTVAFVSGQAGGGGGGGVASYPAISDDGVFVATGTQLDFTDNISVSNTGTVVFISATDTDTPTYPYVSDDGSGIATGTHLEFGSNLSVVSTGTVVFIDATDTNTDTPTYPAIYDSNSFVATGTNISFDTNLSVVNTGTSVFVSSTASGGGSDLSVYATGTLLITGTTGLAFDDTLSVTSTGTTVFVDAPSDLLAYNYTGDQTSIYPSPAFPGKFYLVSGTITPFRMPYDGIAVIDVSLAWTVSGTYTTGTYLNYFAITPDYYYSGLSFSVTGAYPPTNGYTEKINLSNQSDYKSFKNMKFYVPLDRGGHFIALYMNPNNFVFINNSSISVMGTLKETNYLLDDDYNYLLDEEGNVLLES